MRTSSLAWILGRPIAHRGLHNPEQMRPENTLAAFAYAMRSGTPIELDVQATADVRAAVIHDVALARLTGAPGHVPSSDYDELTKLRVLGSDERIPVLEEVLELVAGRVPLLIEIKNTGAVGPLERQILLLLRDYDGPVAVQSFNPLSLRYIRRAAPAVPRGQISGLFRTEDLEGVELPRVTRFLLRNLLLIGLSRPSFITYQLDGMPSAAVSATRRLGLPTLAWTVRSPAEEARARAYADNFLFEAFAPSLS